MADQRAEICFYKEKKMVYFRWVYQVRSAFGMLQECIRNILLLFLVFFCCCLRKPEQ